MCGCNIGKRRKNMKKRRTSRRRASVRGLNTKDAGSLIMQGVLPGALGAILAKKAVEYFLPAQYAQYSNYAIGAVGIGAALMVKSPLAKAAGLGAATVAGSNIVADLVDGQSVSGLGLLAPGVPSVRIAEQQYTTVPRWSPFNDNGIKVQ